MKGEFLESRNGLVKELLKQAWRVVREFEFDGGKKGWYWAKQ